MAYVKELLLHWPLHVLLHRRRSRSCRPAEAKALCFPFGNSDTTGKLIDRWSSADKLVTVGRFYNSVLTSMPQLVIEIVFYGIVMATILANFALVRRPTNYVAALMLRTFVDLLFLFMHDLWSGSLLHNFTPFCIVLFLSVPLYKADSFLTQLYRIFFDDVANAAQSNHITCVYHDSLQSITSLKNVIQKSAKVFLKPLIRILLSKWM